MKFRKLVLCMFVGIILINFSNIYAYAAEEITANQDQESATEDIVLTGSNTENSNIEDGLTNVFNIDEDMTEETNSIEITAVDIKTDELQAEESSEEEFQTEDSQKDAEEAAEEAEADASDNKEAAQVVKKEVAKYTKAELRLLSAIIYCEAQGESYNGKLAVGIVVMNRVRSSKYPDTVKDVIYQKYQFSPVRSGSMKRALAEYDEGNFTSAAEKECIKAAKAALSGEKTITVKGEKKNFAKYLSFSGRIKGYTFKLGNHQFK